MTKSQKENLIAYLDEVVPKVPVVGCDAIYWNQADVKIAIVDMAEEPECSKASLDYKAECARLTDEMCKLRIEKTELLAKAEDLKQENERLQIILKTFEFALGRKFDA